jgi:DNA-binding protein H-NS
MRSRSTYATTLEESMPLTEELSAEIQEALAALDKATDEVAVRLRACAEFVNAGKLSPDEMMLRIAKLQARLMGVDQ